NKPRAGTIAPSTQSATRLISTVHKRRRGQRSIQRVIELLREIRLAGTGSSVGGNPRVLEITDGVPNTKEEAEPEPSSPASSAFRRGSRLTPWWEQEPPRRRSQWPPVSP